jgi:cellulose synthase/poly-beta-1,6-N-acetylglucosamine synthase-like glycosyltransferase
MSHEGLLIGVTAASFGFLLYTYAGYPGLLWCLSKWTRVAAAASGDPPEWPTVSVLVSAYNEERVIADRLTNLRRLDYPPDRLEILVGSDGSTDRTCEIARAYEDRRARLVAFARRRGKASVVNDLIARARGEIVILTDANTYFEPEAVRELVSALRRSPSACTVVGSVEVRSSVAAGNLDGVYWRYETWIKTLESRFGSVLGANGPIYAFRRDQYQPLPPRAIVDDFLIPMLMRLRSGGQIFFTPSARAWETSPERVHDEFRRRVRIGAGDLQALMWTWPLLLPWKGMVAFSYLSHKVLRWLGPWFMLSGFAANVGLLHVPWCRWLLVGQVGAYGTGLAAAVLRRVPVVGGAATALRYFLVLNAAILLGSVRFVLGVARPVWSPTPRRA